MRPPVGHAPSPKGACRSTPWSASSRTRASWPCCTAQRSRSRTSFRGSSTASGPSRRRHTPPSPRPSPYSNSRTRWSSSVPNMRLYRVCPSFGSAPRSSSSRASAIDSGWRGWRYGSALALAEHAGEQREQGRLAVPQVALVRVRARIEQQPGGADGIPAADARVGQVGERPPAVRAAAAAGQARVAAEQAGDDVRPGRGGGRPDVVVDEVRVRGEERSRRGPAVRSVGARVRQAREPAEPGGHRLVGSSVGVQVCAARGVEVVTQPRPAREAVLAGDGELGGAQPEAWSGRPAGAGGSARSGRRPAGHRPRRRAAGRGPGGAGDRGPGGWAGVAMATSSRRPASAWSGRKEAEGAAVSHPGGLCPARGPVGCLEATASLDPTDVRSPATGEQRWHACAASTRARV